MAKDKNKISSWKDSPFLPFVMLQAAADKCQFEIVALLLGKVTLSSEHICRAWQEFSFIIICRNSTLSSYKIKTADNSDYCTVFLMNVGSPISTDGSEDESSLDTIDY